jgi:hypothetical protein
MLRFCRYSGFSVVSFAALLNFCGSAQAITYEQAWARCKKEVTRSYPNELAGTNARYAMGMSCMSRYGYRLKRAARSELGKKSDD